MLPSEIAAIETFQKMCPIQLGLFKKKKEMSIKLHFFSKEYVNVNMLITYHLW